LTKCKEGKATASTKIPKGLFTRKALMVSQERIAAYCLSEGTTERLLRRFFLVKPDLYEAERF